MLNAPNIITLVRIGLVPVTAYYLATKGYGIALPVFLVAALSDFADGYVARRFKLVSRLGATLDPIADKLNMLVATVFLTLQGLLPLWLAIAIVARDAVIVLGALAYRTTLGHVKIAPTRLSKINTAIEFAVLLLVMASAASWIDVGAWLKPFFVLAFISIVVSGVQYVWVWGRKAIAEGRTR
jgi:cardiolipin synthase